MIEGIALRPATAADEDFLAEMTREATIARFTTPPSMEYLKRNSIFRLYFEDWGKPGDDALIAVDSAGWELGAALRRPIQPRAVAWRESQETPEIAIGVRSQVRGEGIGGFLLDGLIERARRDGIPRLYLLALEDNKVARGLYESRGFVTVDRGEVELRDEVAPVLKMVISLDNSPAPVLQ